MRTILALVILLILVHAGLVYAGVRQRTNQITDAIYSLGKLLESPATLLLNAVSSTGRVHLDTSSFVVALTAAAGYFALYLLLGVGRD